MSGDLFWALYFFFFVPFFRLGGGLKNWELSHGSWWQGVHGSWLQSQNAELSSLSASSVVLASQKCLQSKGSGGSWSRNSELSSLLASPVVLASQKSSTVVCAIVFLFLWILFAVDL